MVDLWRRSWFVGGSYFRFNYFGFSGVNPSQSLLRMWVSWHAVGDARAANEPLFVGVQLISGEAGTLPAPDDPADNFGIITGDWVEFETHAPVRDYAEKDQPTRWTWPRGGYRLWDIKSNRKMSATDRLVPYLVWALPQGSLGTVAMRVTYSQLIRNPV